MGNCNCCLSPSAAAHEDIKHHHSPKPSSSILPPGSASAFDRRYSVDLDRELGRGEFGVTYLCLDRSSHEALACKSISKKKLRTAVDVEDVRREVAIMRHLPANPSIVSLREAREDERAVHLVMELCEGGGLFDRIVARGHYTEQAAAGVVRTIVEVVQICHRHGVIHRDLKPENFLFANKKEGSPLKSIEISDSPSSSSQEEMRF